MKSVVVIESGAIRQKTLCREEYISGEIGGRYRQERPLCYYIVNIVDILRSFKGSLECMPNAVVLNSPVTAAQTHMAQF